jgi:hypothetical protein
MELKRGQKERPAQRVLQSVALVASKRLTCEFQLGYFLDPDPMRLCVSRRPFDGQVDDPGVALCLRVCQGM